MFARYFQATWHLKQVSTFSQREVCYVLILFCSSIWQLYEVLSISLAFPAFTGSISIQGFSSYPFMTSIIPSIWTSILTQACIFVMHLFYLLVQAYSLHCQFLQVNQCVKVYDSFILLGFVHRACSTRVAMVKIKPRANPTALSAEEEASSLLFALRWCNLSRSPFSSVKCLLPVLPSLLSWGVCVFSPFLFLITEVAWFFVESHPAHHT